jgi:predicted short-subunit dehydrogenase-like oxidoreductase (DUF2520 family)
MDIAIIGSGNVASILGRKMLASGHRIVKVIARNEQTGKKLAGSLGALYSADLTIPNQDANLYLAAVSDDGLRLLGQYLKIKKAVVVHTAGSVPMDVLKDVSTNYGVLYPLQTLRAEMDEVPEFPLLIDANTPDTLTLLRDLAETVSSSVVNANDEYRREIHMAAVISGNFTNHLFAIVQDYCRERGLDFSLLLPQIQQIVSKLGTGHAAERQTGPAIRNDVETLKRHDAMLHSFPEIRVVYEVLTASIRKYHQIKDHS